MVHPSATGLCSLVIIIQRQGWLVSQWGQQGQRYGAPTQWRNQPNQWGTAPRQQVTWSPQTSQIPHTGYGGVYGRPPARRGGSGNALRMLILAIGAIIAGMIVISMLSSVDDPGGPVVTDPGQYQNEEYQVPPIDTNPPELPMPTTYGEASQWLVDNPIYNANVSMPVRCEAQPIDLMNASKTELEDHFNELTGCLMRVFGPSLESVGFIPVRPSVTVYSSEINTRCGTMPRMNAAYCSADQQVYYASDLPQIIPAQLRNTNYVVESVIAHEFAHAIQGRAGILISSAAWEQNSNEATANEFSRRLEVQADCWSGQFMSSVGQSVGVDANGIDELARLFHSIGDDVLTGDPGIEGNHGRGASRMAWFLAGSQSSSMGTCNAFNAAASEVR